MWKYKLSCPFGGRGATIFCLSLVGAVITFFVMAVMIGTGTIAIGEDIAFAVTLGIPPFTMLITFIVVHWRTKSDREQIANAQPPEWKPLNLHFSDNWNHFESCESTMIFMGMQSQTKQELLNLVYYGIFLILSLSFIIVGEIDIPFFWYLLLAIMLFSLIMMIVIVSRYLYWQKIPKGLEYCSISVSESYLVPYMSRYERRRHSSILVYYLPSGKYHIYMNTDSPPSIIYFVRSRWFVRWVYWT